MRQSPVRAMVGLALAVGLLAAAGCGGQKGALEISESVVEQNKRLFSVGQDFRGAVNRAFKSGEEPDVARVRNMFNQMNTLLDKVIADTKGLGTFGVDGAGDFKASALHFYEGEKGILETDYKPVVEALETKGFGEENRKELIQKAFASARVKEEGLLGGLRSAQQTFASKHNIALQNSPVP